MNKGFVLMGAVPPVTHSDEALDDVDSILIELKAS